MQENAKSGDMFKGATSLVGGSGTKYNSSYVDKTYARIDNPPDSPVLVEFITL